MKLIIQAIIQVSQPPSKSMLSDNQSYENLAFFKIINAVSAQLNKNFK